VSRPNKKLPKSQTKATIPAESRDNTTLEQIMDRLHPSLRENFVLLPPAGITLTPDQLAAIFGGDLRGLSALAQLAYQSNKNE
jgi:hypothetical protein